MITVGIDAGSRTIKVVIFHTEGSRILAKGSVDQGVNQQALIDGLYNRLLCAAGISLYDVTRVIATGYSRALIAVAESTVTEITCHARGVRHLQPDARSIMDIGGEDSKFIQLDHDGCVRDFVMNDRCAAGTGRFLELVAHRLGVDVSRLGELAAGNTQPAPINSTCAVFAETEIVGLLAANTSPESIAAGVRISVAQRAATMAGGHHAGPVILTGGVAMLPGMCEALAAAMGSPVQASEHPMLTGALGAALIAAERGPSQEVLQLLKNG